MWSVVVMSLITTLQSLSVGCVSLGAGRLLWHMTALINELAIGLMMAATELTVYRTIQGLLTWRYEHSYHLLYQTTYLGDLHELNEEK